jgi:hypothetical protein
MTLSVITPSPTPAGLSEVAVDPASLVVILLPPSEVLSLVVFSRADVSSHVKPRHITVEGLIVFTEITPSLYAYFAFSASFFSTSGGRFPRPSKGPKGERGEALLKGPGRG